jgi:hypothetical protein
MWAKKHTNKDRHPSSAPADVFTRPGRDPGSCAGVLGPRGSQILVAGLWQRGGRKAA